MSLKRCKNTGLDPFKCNCLDCFPSIHPFKFMALEAECESLDDIIDAVKAQIEYFKQLKEEGYSVKQGISIDYLQIHPPRHDGYYWGRCKGCGHHLELPIGTQQPRICEYCEGAISDG